MLPRQFCLTRQLRRIVLRQLLCLLQSQTVALDLRPRALKACLVFARVIGYPHRRIAHRAWVRRHRGERRCRLTHRGTLPRLQLGMWRV